MTELIQQRQIRRGGKTKRNEIILKPKLREQILNDLLNKDDVCRLQSLLYESKRAMERSEPSEPISAPNTDRLRTITAEQVIEENNELMIKLETIKARLNGGRK